MRNRAVLTVVVALGVLSWGTGCTSTSTPAAGDTPSSMGAAVPVAAGSTSDATPASAVSATSKAPAASAEKTGGTACPVSAATLQAAAKLPAGFKIVASSIDCWNNAWAVAGVKAPTPPQQGDGLVLFRYSASTGKWTKSGEGSSFDCATDLGLTKGAAHPSWCTFSEETGGNACPVSAATLQAAAKLAAGFKIVASSIDCWNDAWAVAGVKAPTPAQQGDGLVLFRYSAGKWAKVTEGSEFDCAEDLGLAKGAAHPSWCFFG